MINRMLVIVFSIGSESGLVSLTANCILKVGFTMIDRRKLMTDIYMYYPKSSDNSDNIKSKQLLRHERIDHKGLFVNQNLFHDMKAVFKEYAVVDWTDEYACCYEIKILLHENQNILDDDRKLLEVLGGTRYDLRIFISVLEPYYYIFLEETTYIEAEDQWLFSTIKFPRQDMAKIIRNIDNCLLLKGYKKLSENDVIIVVPQIETDLKKLNEVIIFDCLFTDMVNLS